MTAISFIQNVIEYPLKDINLEISNRFAALEDLDAEVEINSAWEMIREKLGNYWGPLK
jgi:hypothetical protein